MRKLKIFLLFLLILFLNCFFSLPAYAQSGEIKVQAMGPNTTVEYFITNTSNETLEFGVVIGDRYVDVFPFALAPGQTVMKDGSHKLSQIGNYPVELRAKRPGERTSNPAGNLVATTTLTVTDDPAKAGEWSYSAPLFKGATRPETCGSGDTGIQTAIGCIPTQPKDLVAKLLQWGISMAGGIAFLLMIWAGFQYITSTGNPEKLQEAQSILTSAIAGLLLVIFSVFLLRLIGVTVLGIPGFE